jgi:hypothetical protein
VLSARSTNPAITSPVTVPPLVKERIRFATIVRRHFGEHGLLSGSTCWMTGELEHDVATPFAQRLLAGFGQLLETSELEFRYLETDASDS